MQSNLSCITCSKKVIEDELVEVMYKYLIKHEEMQRKHELEKLKRKGKVEIYDALKVRVHSPNIITIVDIYIASGPAERRSSVCAR